MVIKPEDIQTIDVGVVVSTNYFASTPDGPVPYKPDPENHGFVKKDPAQVIAAPPAIYLYHGPVV